MLTVWEACFGGQGWILIIGRRMGGAPEKPEGEAAWIIANRYPCIYSV